MDELLNEAVKLIPEERALDIVLATVNRALSRLRSGAAATDWAEVGCAIGELEDAKLVVANLYEKHRSSRSSKNNLI